MRYAPLLWTALLLTAPASAQQASERINVDVEDMQLGAVLDQISAGCGHTVVLDRGIDETVSVSLRDIPWHEAVEVIARMTRCQVEELPGGVVLVTQPATVTVAGQDLSARGAFELIAKTAGHGLLVLPGTLEGAKIPSLDLKEVDTDTALHTLAGLLKVAVYRVGATLVVAPEGHAPPPGAAGEAPAFSGGSPVSLDVEGVDLADVCEQIGKQVGKNVLVDPAVQEVVQLRLQQVPWKDAVSLLARLTGCTLELHPGGIVILQQPPRVTIQAAGASAPALLRMLAVYAGKNVAAAPGAYPSVTLELQDCSFLDALQTVAWYCGARTEESEDDMLAVQAPAAQAPATRPQDELATLVDAIEERARAGDAAAVRALTQELLQRLEGPSPSQEETSAGERPLDSREQQERLDELFREITQLAEERRVDELVKAFTELRALLDDMGDAAAPAARERLKVWSRRLEGLGEVKLSIELQVDINEGNRLLQKLGRAGPEGDREALERAHEQLKQLIASMRDQDREVFHRNADALQLRGQRLYEQGGRLARLQSQPLRVSAIVCVPEASDDKPAALINGVVCHPGDFVQDPQGQEIQGLMVSEILAGSVRFSFQDLDFVRELGGD